MKPILLSAIVAAGLASPSWAATEIDADGDGMLSLEEVQAVYPDVTEEQFTEMDVNGDGALDDDEVTAAQEAGTMPKEG